MFIPLREDGKAALARAFDGARAACGARGRELVGAGVLDRVDDVFYLTMDEVRGTWSNVHMSVGLTRWEAPDGRVGHCDSQVAMWTDFVRAAFRD